MKNIKNRYVIFRAAVILFAAIVLIHAVHGLTLDKIIQYKEMSFRSPNITAELDGYRIAFISDTHRSLTDKQFERIVGKLNGLQVDLLILGGDYSPTERMRRAMAILSQVETTDGIYGVEGNHDDHRVLFPAMKEHNITPLSNSGVHIREKFFLSGVEDLWKRNPDIAQATADANADDFILLISHNPDVAMQQDTASIDLILSGHTHGGQITFFGLWAPAAGSVSSYGQKFIGWAESRDGVPVYVSNGAGEYMPRIFARPQVIIITLIHE